MARECQSRDPAKCCLLSPTKSFVNEAHFAPAPCRWEWHTPGFPAGELSGMQGIGMSLRLPDGQCMHTHGCPGLGEGRRLGWSRCSPRTCVSAELMGAQCRVFSACSHLPHSVPPCSSPLSLCQRQLKAQQQRGSASQELSALKTQNGEEKMCFPPALLSQSDIKEALDRPQHGTREDGEDVGACWCRRANRASQRQQHPLLSVRQVIPRMGHLTSSVCSLSLPAPSQFGLIWTSETEGVFLQWEVGSAEPGLWHCQVQLPRMCRQPSQGEAASAASAVFVLQPMPACFLSTGRRQHGQRSGRRVRDSSKARRRRRSRMPAGQALPASLRTLRSR